MPLYQRLISAWQKQPPISIELYPLEIYFVTLACLSWLIFNPGNKTVTNVFKRLQSVLIIRYPHLQSIVSQLLAKGVQVFYENTIN